ncbi:MAG: hypothetical protein PHU44_11020 [Syntrophales bacterium]|nr:hypothetical protein [Syntrophales bacterium]MDD5640081.1 hypothetical protein [Syntrophales bacterium]
MRRPTFLLMALILLAGLIVSACSQENALGNAVAQLFKDQKQVKQVSYAAWKTARDEGPRASLKKSSELLHKASALADETSGKGAADAFAAWWYNIAAQYWTEIEAQKPGGESFNTAVARIIKARRDLEKALGWDEAKANQLQQEAYKIMQGYK